MRAEYKDEEVVALGEIMKLLAEEISRNTTIIVADLDHLLTCESQEHKATVIKQAKAALANILTHLRYCAWIEAEVTPTRVFSEPLSNLAELVNQQEALAAEFKARQEAKKNGGKPAEPETLVPPAPEIVIVQPENLQIELQAIEMEKGITVPFPKTKQ